MKIANQEVTLLDHMGSDLSVVNAARVSFDKESDWERIPVVDHDYGSFTEVYEHQLSEKDQKLIKYLAKHNHKSPFNHCFASFRVKAPIFVARQLVKHEYMPWNEVSRRYVDSEPEFYFPSEWRARAENVKQGSSEEAVDLEAVLRDDPEWGDYWPQDASRCCLDTYQTLLKAGVCAEQARMVLPQSMMTEWIWSGSLFAIAKMCKLRLDSHSQAETREIAQLIAKEMSVLYPNSWAALMEN